MPGRSKPQGDEAKEEGGAAQPGDPDSLSVHDQRHPRQAHSASRSASGSASARDASAARGVLLEVLDSSGGVAADLATLRRSFQQQTQRLQVTQGQLAEAENKNATLFARVTALEATAAAAAGLTGVRALIGEKGRICNNLIKMPESGKVKAVPHACFGRATTFFDMIQPRCRLRRHRARRSVHTKAAC